MTRTIQSREQLDLLDWQGPDTVVAYDDVLIRANSRAGRLARAISVTLDTCGRSRRDIADRMAEPAEFSFADGEIRMARFTAAFYRDPEESSAGGLFAAISDSLTHALTAADALVDQGILACQTILSPLAIPVALAGAVSGMLSEASGVWDALISDSAQPVQDAASSAQATLAAGVTAPATNSDTTYADAVSAALAGVPAALANASATSDTAAIAPSAQVADGVTLTADPQAVTTVLLSGAVQLGDAAATLSDTSTAPSSVLGLGVIARLMAVTQAVASAASVTYVSQQDAMSGRDALLDAIDALGTDIENAAALGAAFAMSRMWGALRDLRTAVIADYSDRIGRLPAVISVTLGAQVSAWLVAYAVAGDAPSDVETVMEDLVTRNDLIHPALAGPGALDVLDLTS
ncbi:RodZ family helix-turn-helix domain-containing protein [Acidomonas methanolica]|uniref:Mu-like prophage DNA circulation protein n=1 Tax=Acidomonas methanolica NBRC 104435 TaxID=1231351 RepID=A0A023D943_ACIMT|nr:hypothetical protein [Acidomonas methanolica]MBU2653458.1 hypothetical protein [Acidomonas methanolica]TCS32411.1 hypothetical protein EDC31_101352 [Acidomonas methanolica]GAJ30215.1 hypothetical protein Amme_112_003 [Acidomonas methanolica NBRC 104435]GBQ52847.1 hypothetical protein AA0498_1815 [Acidomonas methanolica]GEK97847.1 hypothetical protein AME01nite_03460 [Acidomonas methanolica NBRC 104435]